jgi:branched-chain amino acid transport system substrate-binding protein
MREDLERLVRRDATIARDLGAVVSEAFREERARMAALVDKQLIELRDRPNAPHEVVQLSATVPTGSSSDTSGGGAVAPRLDPTPTRARVRHRVVAGAAVAAVVATLVAVSFAHRAGVSPQPRGAAPTGCESNAACTKAIGAPALCRAPGAPCTPVLSQDCNTMLGDVTAEGAFLFGALYPRSGADEAVATRGEPGVRATDLALREFTTAAVGLPAPERHALRRPIAAVVCDLGVDMHRAAAHLIDDLGVQAIVGTVHSEDSLELAVRETVPKGVLLLCPFSTSPALSTLADDGLVWRSVTPSTYEARAIGSFVSEIEKRVRTTQHMRETDTVRLAMLVRRGYLGSSIAEIATDQLRVNRKSAAANEHDFDRVDYDEHLDPAAASAVAREIVSFRPHIVVTAGLTELAESVVPGVEEQWPADATSKPVYVFNSDAVVDPSFRTLVASSANLRGRVFGSVPVPQGDRHAYDAYSIRYRATFERGGADSNPEWAASAYDAVYALVYAAVASGAAVPTGRDLARGMTRLTSPGVRADVGPGDVDGVLAALAAGSHVVLQGAGGALDFDPRSGDPVENVALACFERDTNGKLASGRGRIVYDARTGKTSGELRCP